MPPGNWWTISIALLNAVAGEGAYNRDAKLGTNFLQLITRRRKGQSSFKCYATGASLKALTFSADMRIPFALVMSGESPANGVHVWLKIAGAAAAPKGNQVHS